MTSRNRKALWITAVVIVLIALSGAAIITSLTRIGQIEINVVEKGPNGSDIHISIPAAFMVMGITFIPGSVFAEIGPEERGYLSLARHACHELSEIEDCTLVSVEDGDERVKIIKRGDNLIVHVEDFDADLLISIPVAVADKVLGKLSGF